MSYLSPYNNSRFWSKVEARGADECWEWTGARNGSTGIFRVYENRRVSQYNAHRYAYMTVNDVEPEWIRQVAISQTCGNSLCCNPAHLELRGPVARLMEKVDKTDDCWEWTGATNGKWGIVRVLGIKHRVQDIVWTIGMDRKIRSGCEIVQKCGNLLCCRPKHLKQKRKS